MFPTFSPQAFPGSPKRGVILASFFAALLLTLFAAQRVAAANPPFPGAVGWGATSTTGGTGGTVYHVTNLNDSGTGSFRDAVAHSGRIIVFDVGGYINVLSAVTAQSNLTIAGETAPGDGIGVYGAEVSFTGRSNCIVRHVRFRQGSLDPKGTGTSNSSGNCINLGTTTNMIFDHCSFEFASYNNVDAVTAVNLTFQNCIFADPIKAQQFAVHFEGGPATFIGCLWANAHNRCPLAKGNVQYVNNVVYDYQAGFTAGNTSGKFDFDIVNNYFITGPATTSSGNDFYQVPSNCSAYAAGNILDGNNDGALNGSADNSTGATVLSSYYFSSSSTVPTASLPILTAEDAFVTAVANAGALPHDQVDTLVASDVLSLGTQGKLHGDQTDSGLSNNGYGVINGGQAPVDSDADGLPDFWEDAFGANLSPTATTGALNDGYTNLEQYFHWLAGPHTWVSVNTPVDIDLAQYMPGFSSVAYTVTSLSNGTATLNSDGHTAHFVPVSGGFTGMASFSFTATALGGSYTNTLSVLVSSGSASPTAPVGVTATAGDGQVALSWTASSGATSYSVLRGTASGGSYTAIATGLTVTTYTDTGLGDGTTYYYVVTASNVNGTGGYSAEASATPLPLAPPIISSALSAGVQVGQPSAYQITATNTPTSYGASGLPTGLSVDATSGLISGTPTQSGTFVVSLVASNSGGTGTATLSLTVSPAPPPVPVINTADAANGLPAKLGTPFTYQIAASNSPTSFSASGLPAGLSVDVASGLISGTPTATGLYQVTLGATSLGGTGNAVVSIMVADILPTISATVLVPQVTAGSGEVAEFELLRSGDDLSSQLMVAYTVKGTAVGGTDYVLLKGTKKMKPGKASVKIKVSPLGAGAGPGVKRTVVLTLAPGEGYIPIGSKAKVKIIGQ